MNNLLLIRGDDAKFDVVLTPSDKETLKSRINKLKNLTKDVKEKCKHLNKEDTIKAYITAVEAEDYVVEAKYIDNPDNKVKDLYNYRHIMGIVMGSQFQKLVPKNLINSLLNSFDIECEIKSIAVYINKHGNDKISTGIMIDKSYSSEDLTNFMEHELIAKAYNNAINDVKIEIVYVKLGLVESDPITTTFYG